MKILILTVLLLCTGGITQAQNDPAFRGEFANQSNGLMYSPAAMQNLQRLVEAEHLRFKNCSLDKTYYSMPQSRIRRIEFSSKTNNLLMVKKDLQQGMTYEELLKKYKQYISHSAASVLIVLTKDKEDPYLSGSPFEGYDDYYTGSQKLAPGKWLIKYTRKDEDNDAYSIEASRPDTAFASTAIPDEYARLIQYVDCMVDTSAVVFLTKDYDRLYYFATEKQLHPQLKGINQYLNGKMNINKQHSNYSRLTDDKIDFAAASLKNDTAFLQLYSRTVANFADSGKYHYTLERLAAKMNMKDKELLMKRCLRVMGNCSQDDSPRRHALSIALLAGETQSWNIFMRSHLDIMNDRFERMTDGSYAWEQRQTYLKELEELNLNVVDLVLGLCLRSANTAENHYYGTVWRLGKAMAESRDQAKFEERIIAMMKDARLDAFNRGLLFLLYHSYLNRLKSGDRTAKVAALKAIYRQFPEDIGEAVLKINEKTEEDK